MKLQTASENNIIHGQATVMGAVTPDGNRAAWILPGGRYTFSEGRARAVARAIDKEFTGRRAATA